MAKELSSKGENHWRKSWWQSSCLEALVVQQPHTLDQRLSAYRNTHAWHAAFHSPSSAMRALQDGVEFQSHARPAKSHPCRDFHLSAQWILMTRISRSLPHPSGTLRPWESISSSEQENTIQNIHKPKNLTGLVACQESRIDSCDVVRWYVCVTNQAFQDLVCSMIGWCTNQYPTTLPTLSRGRHSRDNELHQEWSLSRARRTLYHGKWFLQAPLHCQLLLLIQPSVLNPCRRPSHYLAYLRRYQFQKNKEVTTDLERT